MTALRVIDVQVEALIPAARNSRTHSDTQVAQIAGSIREFGFTNPVLMDGTRGIIAGHGRVLAARKLGMAKVPCIELAHLSETQKRAYILADNKLALNAWWDLEMLGSELQGLVEEGFDVDLTGFSGDELSALLADKTEGLTDPDEVPEVPAEPVSVLGDVWVLGGKHRLVCGDSTDADVVGKCLNGVVPHLMVTDPPYGVEYDPAWRNDPKLKGIIHGGGRTDGPVLNDDRGSWREAWALFPGEVAYVWCGQIQVIDMGLQLQENGFELRNLIVWAKSQHVLTRGHYHSQQETCWYGVRKGKTAHLAGDRSQTTLWRIDKPLANESGHSTQKPVDAMKRPIENNSSPGQAVYEPFSGSGTTLIAGEMTGRSIHAIELSPVYVDVACQRWMKFTGLKATLEADGRTFDEIAGSRVTPD